MPPRGASQCSREEVDTCRLSRRPPHVRREYVNTYLLVGEQVLSGTYAQPEAA